MPNNRSLHILFFADDRHLANSVIDHINANLKYSRHHWTVINPIGIETAEAINFDYYDAIAIHYSVCVLFEWMLKPAVIEKIKKFKGPKFQFIQDEYRWVNQISAKSAELGINTIFTLVAPENAEKVYSHPGLRDTRKVSVLAGYVPENLENIDVPPIDGRPLDMVYRSRMLQFFLGKLAYEKRLMAEGVERLAPQYGLKVDVSVAEEKRIYGQQWLDFLRSGRTVLGTEGGSSIMDLDSSAERVINEYLATHPDAGFEEVHEAVLKPYEGNIMYNTLSPRIFEAAAIRTPMVLFPGWYNGVVKPDVHYIRLEKDFSNFADVAKKVRDTPLLEDMAARTYEDLVQSKKYSMQSYINIVDNAVTETVYGNARFAGMVAKPAHFSSKQQAHNYLKKSIRGERRLVRLKKIKEVLARGFRRFNVILADSELSKWQKIRIIFKESQKYLFGFAMRKIRYVLARFSRFIYCITLPLRKIYNTIPWIHPYWRALRRSLQYRS